MDSTYLLVENLIDAVFDKVFSDLDRLVSEIQLGEPVAIRDAGLEILFDLFKV